MKAVSDSSILISLSQIGQLELLREMFSEVFIPEEVYNEVVTKGGDRAGAINVKNAGWIKVSKVKNVRLSHLLGESLDSGEAEAIALALELKADIVLLDERDARKKAKNQGLKVLGVIGVLVWGKKKGRIKLLRPVLETLIKNNFRISEELFSRVLDEVGEK